MKWIIRGIIVVVLLVSLFDIGICYIIRDEAGGCDCENIGTWSPDTLTCTLTGDVEGIIEIDDDGITLDGNGYSANEIYVIYKNGFIIENFIGASYINTFGINFLDSDVDPGIIRDNTITGVYHSIDIYDGNYIEITDNTISHCSGGIHLSRSSNINITNNTIHDNKFYGIGCYDSSLHNNIIDNTIFDNNECGISLIADWHQNINNNTINGNNYGIYLWMTCYHNISNNTISNNIDDGIWLDGDNDRNTIKNNCISYNGRYGINVLNSVNNTLYYNNLVDNVINNGYESLEYGSNQWHYNYWSDYNESCVDSDNDGICDSPYDIPGGTGRDMYPRVCIDWRDEWMSVNSDGGAAVTTVELQAAIHHWL
ncbi:MAG: NosD domain-containing protein, partial [Euryarchaeota archaeon]|nr:NosD domain-containing protein [Euryarchaeota archaeon]